MAHTVDENGYIYIKDNPISKSGVFQYLGKNISPDLIPDKPYNVWRPEEELNNPETIESFKLSPWIPRHEMLGDNHTDAEKVGVRGVTGQEVYYKGDTLFSNLKLFASDLKQSIEDGLKELSCGFKCVYQIVSGTTPQGEPYDVIQKKIRGNHLASVPNGRMGKQVAVAMDRAIFALDNLNLEPKPSGDDMTLEELKAENAKLKKEIADGKKSAEDAKIKAAEDAKAKEAEDAEKKKKEEEDEKEKKGNPFAKKDDEKSGMDADVFATMLTNALEPIKNEIKEIKSSALDANSVMKEMTEKNALAEKASAIVGAFDHADMNKQDVAKYALDKMSIACDAGLEVATLNGFLAARKQPNLTIDHGQDEGEGKDSHSEALGL